MDPFRTSSVSFTCKVDFAYLGAPKSNGSGAKRGNFMPNLDSEGKSAAHLAGVLAPQIELSEGRPRGQKCKTGPSDPHPARVWVLEAGGALWTLWPMTLKAKNGQKWPKMVKNGQKWPKI